MASLLHIPNRPITYWIFGIIMVLLAMVTFQNLATHDFWDGWDDRQLVADAKRATDNPGILFSSQREQAVRPTIDIIFLIGYALWQDNPVAFHCLQILLHLLATFLLAYTFRLLNIDVELSLISATLFFLNVAHFRAIHWITCISYTTGLICCLLVFNIYISQIKRPGFTRHIAAALALIAGIFAHPGIATIIPLCALWTWYETRSIKQTFLRIRVLFFVSFFTLVIAIWVSPKANQVSMLSLTHNIPTLIQNLFWYLGRLFSSAFWLTQTTSSYTKPQWEILLGVCVGLYLIYMVHKTDRAIAIWAFWIILFVLIFVNSQAYRLVFGPSRHLYFASAGASLLLAWTLREIIQRVISSHSVQRLLFGGIVISLCLSGMFHLQKAEALSMYFAGRGYAFRVNDESENAHRAAHLFERAIQHEPSILPLDVYVRLTSMSFSIGESHIDLLNDAAKRLHDNPTILMLQGAAAFLDTDETRRRAGEKQISRALVLASDKEDLRPDAALAFQNMASHHHEHQQYENAIFLYQKALEFNPNHVTAYYNMGNALNALGKTEAAMDAYRQALAIEPTFKKPLQNLANTLFEKGEFSAALPIYREIIASDTTDANAHYNLGMALLTQEYFSQAESSFRKAVELDTSDTAALSKLGEALFAQNKYAEATIIYRKLTHFEPDNITVIYNLGLMMFKNGQPEETITLLHPIAQRNSQNVDIHILLASAFESQNRFKEAIDVYQHILAQTPEHTFAQQRLQVLTTAVQPQNVP